MRTALNRVQFSVLVLGLVGACGSSSSPSSQGNGYWDAGHNGGNGGYGDGGNGGAGIDSGAHASACTSVMPGVSGTSCTLPSGSTGFRVCDASGQPTGECQDPQALISSLTGDGGFLSHLNADGGLDNLPDGAVSSAVKNLPACPTNYPCSSTLASFAKLLMPSAPSGVSICAAGFLPESCTMTPDCTTKGFGSGASCTQGYCIQLCSTTP